VRRLGNPTLPSYIIGLPLVDSAPKAAQINEIVRIVNGSGPMEAACFSHFGLLAGLVGDPYYPQ
jgi:hypothetical protein